MNYFFEPKFGEMQWPNGPKAGLSKMCSDKLALSFFQASGTPKGCCSYDVVCFVYLNCEKHNMFQQGLNRPLAILALGELVRRDRQEQQGAFGHAPPFRRKIEKSEGLTRLRCNLEK